MLRERVLVGDLGVVLVVGMTEGGAHQCSYGTAEHAYARTDELSPPSHGFFLSSFFLFRLGFLGEGTAEPEAYSGLSSVGTGAFTDFRQASMAA